MLGDVRCDGPCDARAGRRSNPLQRPRDRLCRRGGGGEPVAGAARRHRRSNRLAGICLSEPESGFLLHRRGADARSEEHTSELQSLMRNSYAVFCLKKKKEHNNTMTITLTIIYSKTVNSTT